MQNTPKDQDRADQRRDELAKRVLNTPPRPKTAKPLPDPKTGKGEKGAKDKPRDSLKGQAAKRR